MMGGRGSPDSEILTIAVVAAKDVSRHHERAAPLQIDGHRYWRDRIGVARVNRRLYQHADGMVWIPANVGGASPRATGSSSIASPHRRLFAAGRAPGAVGRRRGANAAGSVPPNERSSLDGACSSSAARMACPCTFRCCPPPRTPPACGGDWGGASGLPAGAQLLGVAANNYSPQQRG